MFRQRPPENLREASDGGERSQTTTRTPSASYARWARASRVARSAPWSAAARAEEGPGEAFLKEAGGITGRQPQIAGQPREDGVRVCGCVTAEREFLSVPPLPDGPVTPVATSAPSSSTSRAVRPVGNSWRPAP
jgi:hypothetical protein